MSKKYGYLPPSLRRLPARTGRKPRIDNLYPCLQLDDTAPPAMREAFLAWAGKLEGVSVRPTKFSLPADALVLEEELAKGKPEAFIAGREFSIVREEGSVQLSLDPGWGQKVLDKGWATIHPLARYMAGALPPQSMIVYAPRDEKELRVIQKIVEAAYWHAQGRVEDMVLPDSAW